VRTIDEGIELLTGVKAGERLPDGHFEPESVNALVDARLRSMAEALQRFGKDEAPKPEKTEQNNNAG
jgi:hypothetical protein